MDLIKVLFFMFYVTTLVICVTLPFDRDGAFQSLEDDLLSVDPKKETIFLKTRIVNAQKKINDLISEKGMLINEKEIANKKIERVIIPLSVRHMATTIEAECPVANVIVPENSPLKATKDFTNNDVTRTYCFLEIINKFKGENMYVTTLCSALENDFKTSNQVTEIDGMWLPKYEAYKLDFCKSIVIAINHGNKLVAHYMNTGLIKESLSIYANPVDKFVTVFYNALLAHVSSD